MLPFWYKCFMKTVLTYLEKGHDSVCFHPNISVQALIFLFLERFFSLRLLTHIWSMFLFYTLCWNHQKTCIILLLLQSISGQNIPILYSLKAPRKPKDFREYKMGIFQPEMGWSNRGVLIFCRTRNKNILTFARHRPFFWVFSEQKCLTSPSKHLLFLSQR